ncbi:MAG: valine--tRNA ligase [Candidatus Pacebacteria bacterium]|nr:valine--tRNA ligase [Candidatus Paceibacterota bacterium]
MMHEKFLSPYDPQACEDRIYAMWEDSGYFNPDVCVKRGVTQVDATPFTVTLPPPNVTGMLHIGHTYEDSLQDALVRVARMQGKRTLWLPGTDSAAIATQSRVEKNLQKEEKKTRHDLGREELVKRVNAFALEHEHVITGQIRKVGSSLDWSRYAYTLDDKRYHAVMTAFKHMYDAGLIYRGHRIVNWDPKGQTTISDDEIVYEERVASLYTFRYGSNFPIVISTTRPETKVGDTAVAVHPDDERYKKYVGKEYDAVFCDVPIHIKVIADEHVDPKFGTGALGVTPAHSMVDWEIGEKHKLEVKPVISEYAKMTVEGRLKDKKVLEARELVVAWLKEEGLLEKEEQVPQNISTAERTGAIIEPLPKLQWFIAVDKPFTIEHSEIAGIKSGATVTLKEIMRTAVEHGSVSMPQESFRKRYSHWIDNLHDWCISRQIWFGHRIPVWYKKNSDGTITDTYCDVTAPSGDGWVQEEDVLDTWFSSALWTFSTLGWPDKTIDLATFHPTTFMSPAYEILNLWVSRMILMSGFHLGQVPFKTVLIHGLVRDKQGRKFSKSLGNGIDPLDVIKKYGADALRMGLLIGTAIGNDVSFDENKIKGYKNFANKLWNITRFVLTATDDAGIKQTTLHADDATLLAELHTLANEITDDMSNFRLYLAGEKIYHYIWHRFADEILEESKPILQSDDMARKESRARTLYDMLVLQLTLLHPFMPFVTEEIWQALPDKDSDMLMIAKWPA